LIKTNKQTNKQTNNKIAKEQNGKNRYKFFSRQQLANVITKCRCGDRKIKATLVYQHE